MLAHVRTHCMPVLGVPVTGGGLMKSRINLTSSMSI